jgi:3D (Asp-Asp-Asp) domain-containing protein
MKQSSFKIYLLTKTFKEKSWLILFVAILIATFCLPKISSWAYFEVSSTSFFNKVQQVVSFSTKPKIEVLKLYVTAYSSNEDETDDSPCITSSGYNLCQHNKENVIACNFLPIGAKVRFPALDPDKFYIVVDRMHERFNSRMDIWMTSKAKAKKFGIKVLTAEIFKE